jgi:type VI secretion system protein VasD
MAGCPGRFGQRFDGTPPPQGYLSHLLPAMGLRMLLRRNRGSRGVFMTLQQEFIDEARRRTLRCGLWCGAALGTAMLSGCKSAPIPLPFVSQPTKVNGTIVAAPGLNPSVTQRPSPMRLRLYELKSGNTFAQADFMALYQQDKATLGGDLVATEELTLQPGESRPLSRTLASETRVIGIVAIYRDLERAVWRTTVNVQPGKSHQLNIRAEPLAIAATIQP